MSRLRIAGVAATAAVLLLAGCAATGASPAPTWTNVTAVPQDAKAFTTLEKVAPAAAKLAQGAAVEGSQCWTPSEHLFTDPTVAAPTVFRVLCRVHYELAAQQRYTDVVCIGDFAKDPMLDHCFIWKFHYGDPSFDDGDKLASAPAVPLP